MHVNVFNDRFLGGLPQGFCTDDLVSRLQSSCWKPSESCMHPGRMRKLLWNGFETPVAISQPQPEMKASFPPSLLPAVATPGFCRFSKMPVATWAGAIAAGTRPS